MSDDPAPRLHPEDLPTDDLPTDDLTWLREPPRAYVALVDGRPVARVERSRYEPVWWAHLPGWHWQRALPGPGDSRMSVRSGTHSAFRTSIQARRAIEGALRRMGVPDIEG